MGIANVSNVCNVENAMKTMHCNAYNAHCNAYWGLFLHFCRKKRPFRSKKCFINEKIAFPCIIMPIVMHCIHYNAHCNALYPLQCPLQCIAMGGILIKNLFIRKGIHETQKM